MGEEQIFATYRIETAFPLEHAAEVLAGEQSTGTFLSVPGETDEIKKKFRAKVVAIGELETVPIPSLPGAKIPEGVKQLYRGEVTLSFPFHNIGPSIPNLLATVAGNLFELEAVSGIRLLDLKLPQAFHEVYPGPKFGIRGTRKVTGVYERPIIGTIIKPNIGLTPDELRPIVRELAMAGIDFIKDDEVQGNPPYAPLETRVKAVMEEIERAADKTGKKTMYAFNITDDIENLLKNHDIILAYGGNCVMVSMNSIGLAGIAYLRKNSDVPIHGHRNGWGMLSRSPMLGMTFTAYQKLCRLVGVDHLHVNGLNNKFYESNESVIQSVQDCLTPLFGGNEAMPVLSSKQWAGQAVESYQTFKTVDLMNIAGGGIHAHPGGVAAGYRSMVQGWEAALKGVRLEEYAATHIELRQAIDIFGC